LSTRLFEQATQQRPQLGKPVLNDGPEYFRVDRVVAVDDDIAKRDDLCGFGDLLEDRPFEVANAGKSLAEDLELRRPCRWLPRRSDPPLGSCRTAPQQSQAA